jgi:hypothetical protein
VRPTRVRSPVALAVLSVVAAVGTSAADTSEKRPRQVREEIHYLLRANRSRMTECLPRPMVLEVTLAIVDRKARILASAETDKPIVRCLQAVARSIEVHTDGRARLSVRLDSTDH